MWEPVLATLSRGGELPRKMMWEFADVEVYAWVYLTRSAFELYCKQKRMIPNRGAGLEAECAKVLVEIASFHDG